MKTHKHSVNPGFLVTHMFGVSGLNQHKAQAIQTELENMPGVDFAKVNVAKNKLKLSYDGSQHNLDQLLEVTHAHGIVPRSNCWNQIKLTIVRQIDQNVWDNANHHPSGCSGKTQGCCSKPPA